MHYLAKFLSTISLLLIPSLCMAQATWQAGDLIFREGTEVISDLVMVAGQGGFSHVGMLIGDENDVQGWQVIHATPEEIPGRGDAVVIDSLDFFTAPAQSIRHVIYHVNATDEQRLAAVENAQRLLGRPFSILNLDKGIYCTTLVWQAWMQAGVDLEINFTHVELPLIRGQFLFPGDLLDSPLLTPVYP